MTTRILLAVLAAVFFAGGGMLMKPSEGLTRPWPTIGVFVLFIGGAALNILLVRIGDAVGPAYLAVVGCETILAFFLGALLYGERLSPTRLGALTLVLVGVLLLSADGEQVPAADADADSATASTAQHPQLEDEHHTIATPG